MADMNYSELDKLHATWMRFPGGKCKCLTFSFDDGMYADQRFFKILSKYGMRVTYNVNGYFLNDGEPPKERIATTRNTLSEAKVFYNQDGIEVATHAYTHPHLETLPDERIAWEIIRDREELEKLTGGIVKGHAYPFGTYNDDVIRVLKSCGIVYARSVYAHYGFGLPDNWLAWQPTVHQGDDKIFELNKQFIGSNRCNGFGGTPLVYYIWGHTYEFEQNNSWDRMERIIDELATCKDETWYATNMEIYEYVEAYKRLEWSVNGDTVFNPTGTKLWFQLGPFPECVEPGETKKVINL